MKNSVKMKGVFKIKRFIIGCVMALTLCACAQTPISQSKLIGSLTVGVETQSRLAHNIAVMLFEGGASPAQTPIYAVPNALTYKSMPELRRALRSGEIDIAVGHLASHPKHKTIDMTQDLQRGMKEATAFIFTKVSLPFYTLSTHATLRSTQDELTFFSNTKAIGYVSSGKVGKLNQNIIHSHAHAHRFEPCGGLQECVRFLQRGDIDAFTGIDLNFSVSQANDKATYIVMAKYSQQQNFGLVLNPSSLDEQEIHALSQLFFDSSGMSILDDHITNDHVAGEYK